MPPLSLSLPSFLLSSSPSLPPLSLFTDNQGRETFPGADQQRQGSPPRYSQPGVSSSLQIPPALLGAGDAPDAGMLEMRGVLWVSGRSAMLQMLWTGG